MSLFSGTPQQATSYVTSTTETPRWMQDAIYNQIQMAQNVANTPYQSYNLPTVAGLSPLQQQAYSQTQANQGSWQPALNAAQSGFQAMGNSNAGYAAAQPGLTAQATMLNSLQGQYNNPYNTLNPYVNQATGMSGVNAAQPYMANATQRANTAGDVNTQNTLNPYVQQAAGMSGVNAAQPYMNDAAQRATAAGNVNTLDTLNPYLQQATGMSGLETASPYFNTAYSGMQDAGARDTSSGLQAAQNEYLRQGLVDQNLSAGQSNWNRAGQLDAVGAAQPYTSKAADTTAQALSERAMQAASPYLQSAAQSSAAGVNQYLNPYNDAVTSRIAELGGRNLSENLLPNVSDAFIRAGQFGGSRMGEFGARALRDTQESVLGQQAKALQEGYGQALTASQTDLGRQALLANTAGSISGGDLSRVLQGAGQYGQLGSTMGQLTGQQMQGLGSLGQMQTNAGQAQQQFGLNAAQNVQQAQSQDASRQLASAQAQGQLGQAAGNLTQAQQQTLLAAGSAAQQAQSQDANRNLQSAAQLSSIGQNLGGLTQAQQQMLLSSGQALSGAQGQDASRNLQSSGQLSSIGQNLGGLTQAQQQMLLSGGQALSGAQAQGISQALSGASQYGQLASTAGQMGSADANRQLSAYGQLAGNAQQRQQMGLADVGALEAAGTAQQNQAQQQLSAGYNQWQQQQMYPRQQLDWLNTQIRGMAPITPTSTSSTTTQQANTGLSPLSQLASGYSFYRGMNQ